MKKTLSILFVLLIMLTTCGVTTTSAATTKTVIGGFNYNYAKTVCASINAQRKKAKVKTLVYDKALTAAAMKRAAELSVKYSHTRPNGTACSTAFNWTSWFGENNAYGQKTPAQVMKSWMSSKMHKSNILSQDFTRVGVGCYYNQYGDFYWVQAFSDGKSTGACKSSGISYVSVKVSLNKKVATSYSVVKGVPAIKSVTAKVNTYTYDGKYHKPAIVIKDTKGKVVNKKFYQITYPASIKNVGTYYVYVRELYRAKLFKVKINVIPKTPTGITITPTAYSLSLKWNNVAGSYTYYEIQYSKNKNFKNSQTEIAVDPKTELYWLDENTTYYVRVRAYSVTSSSTVYSAWSKTYTVKTASYY